MDTPQYLRIRFGLDLARRETVTFITSFVRAFRAFGAFGGVGGGVFGFALMALVIGR